MTVIFLIIVASYAIFTFKKTYYENAIRQELSGLIKNATFNIVQWTGAQKQYLNINAASPLTRQALQYLLPFAGNPEELRKHPAQNTLETVRKLLPMAISSSEGYERNLLHGRTDILIFSEGGQVLASTFSGFIGAQIGDGAKRPFADAIKSSEATILPTDNLFNEPQSFDTDTHIMMASPIRSPSGDNIGLLAQIIDISPTLTTLIEPLAFRDYGEIYVVNKNGMILTHNRLINEHPQYAHSQSDGSHHKLVALDPLSPSGELTRSASTVAQGYSGVNISGYNDYRGETVVGAWKWMPELEIGLIVEEDVSGAFAGLYQTRNAISLLAGVIVALLFLASVFIQRNQNRIKQSRQHIRDITDNIPGVVFRREMKPGGKPYFSFISRSVLDDILLHRDVNASIQMSETGRLQPHQAQKLYLEMNRLVHEDDFADYTMAVQKSAQDMSNIDHVFRLKTDSGRIKWFKDMSTPVPSEDGNIIWNGIWLDVTKQYKAEQALRNINETLELRVESRTHELADINKNLENTIFERERAEEAALRAKDEALIASRSKSEFLANMSHELRTPLNAIIGFSDLMGQEQISGTPSENWKDYVKYVSESGEHLLSLINDILDYAKAESGRDQLDEHTFPIEHLIKRALRLCLGRAQPDNISLEMMNVDERLSIKGDEKKLKQVLINLVGNSIKFSEKGSKVEVSAKQLPSGGVEIYVKDYGMGISSEDMEKVFEPFGQANTSLNRGIEGTGLGLPLSRSLTELHGGALHLESQPGVGTTAVVYLPPDRVAIKKTEPQHENAEDEL